MSSIRHAFLISPPRTGRTLLARVLDQHPDVAVLHDTFALRPSLPESILHPSGEKAGRHGFSRRDVERWRSLFTITESGENVGIENAIRAIHEEYAARRKARVIVHVDRIWWQVLEELAQYFPGAPCIHVRRDPRGVWWSGQQQFEAGKNRDADGRMHMQALMEAEARLVAAQGKVSLGFCMVRYEDVVHSTEQVIGAVWKFLGVDPAKGWLKHDKNRALHRRRWSAVPNATQAPDPAMVKRWVREMPEPAQAVVSQDSAEFIAAFRYPPTYKNVRLYTVDRWLAGVPLGEIDGGEDVMRAEFVRLRETFNRMFGDIRSLVETVNARVTELEEQPRSEPWQYDYARGVAHGMLNGNDAIAHIINHATRNMVG